METMTAVLVRSPYEVARLRSAQHWPGEFASDEECGDGWRVAFSDHQPPNYDAAVQSFAHETGMPALVALFLDGKCAIVYAAIPRDRTRVVFLGLRTAQSFGANTVGYTLDEARPEMRAWAAAAGTAFDPALLDVALLHDGGEDAGLRLLAALLGGLGIPNFVGTDPFAVDLTADDEELDVPDKVDVGPPQTVEAEAILLVRAPTKVAKLQSAQLWPGGFHKYEQKFKKGWRVGSAGEWPDDLNGALHAFATETQGPVIFAAAADAGFCVVTGTSRPGEYWETVLGLDAAHAVGHCGSYDDSDLYNFYKTSKSWAADAGLTTDDQKLRAAYERPGGIGEEMPMLFVLYAGLGIPGCDHIPAYWDGSSLRESSSSGGWGIEISFG
ncbi:hypothetical protein [Actinomadura atramentaria]|uniref:hypothetical protein n=1 Tax=Actinomadura atramentaria TaxID=1990 RepID=UPI000368B4E2|nr:hypothetical protein [Actinomadura atramentaria]